MNDICQMNKKAWIAKNMLYKVFYKVYTVSHSLNTERSLRESGDFLHFCSPKD